MQETAHEAFTEKQACLGGSLLIRLAFVDSRDQVIQALAANLSLRR